MSLHAASSPVVDGKGPVQCEILKSRHPKATINHLLINIHTYNIILIYIHIYQYTYIRTYIHTTYDYMQSRTAQYVEQKHQRYKVQSWTVERPGLQWCIYVIYTQASLACYTLLAACHNNCTGARHKAIP